MAFTVKICLYFSINNELHIAYYFSNTVIFTQVNMFSFITSFQNITGHLTHTATSTPENVSFTERKTA